MSSSSPLRPRLEVGGTDDESSVSVGVRSSVPLNHDNTLNTSSFLHPYWFFYRVPSSFLSISVFRHQTGPTNRNRHFLRRTGPSVTHLFLRASQVCTRGPRPGLSVRLRASERVGRHKKVEDYFSRDTPHVPVYP